MKISSVEFLKSSSEISQCPKDGFTEFAFIGRSNVGKSSLINMLVNKKNLAKTSGTPGKTRLINHFLVNASNKPWYVVDLPGYGYAKISQTERVKWEKMIWDYLKNREVLACTMVLIDVRLDPQKIDLEFCKKLGEAGLPFAIVFTKADKEKPGAIERNVNAFCNKLLDYFETLPNFIVSSSDTRLGRDQLLSLIEESM
ncbi:MAG: ribosome biogenesis GTP-binding protein YihA/YsxC [Flavobacteriales bacterium]|nr:ribosome biogenesis GTP-binding protein YihA/YsxC [Flavobacteriales bacterium]